MSASSWSVNVVLPLTLISRNTTLGPVISSRCVGGCGGGTSSGGGCAGAGFSGTPGGLGGSGPCGTCWGTCGTCVSVWDNTQGGVARNTTLERAKQRLKKSWRSAEFTVAGPLAALREKNWRRKGTRSPRVFAG